jgi:hypothetical protein
MNEHKSKLESMARALSRAAVVLVVLFVGAAIGGIEYVDNEYPDESSLLHYLFVVGTAGTFLVAAMIAWVGACVIRSLGRVRGSLLDALLPEIDESDPPPPDLSRLRR